MRWGVYDRIAVASGNYVMTTPLERHVAWYPGHMAKALRRIRELLRSIDVAIEIVDARIPRSGRNPALDDLLGRRARIVVLDREDLADPAVTARWLAHFGATGMTALAVDGRRTGSVARVATLISRSAPQGRAAGVSRAMILGIPNSGKSTIVNALLRRTKAKAEDRAGVTRSLQWFRLSAGVELLDTPGVLPPKIAGANAQWRLALCGAVPSERYDPQEVAARFHQWLTQRTSANAVPDLTAFAAHRGFLRRGGEPDYHNAATAYLRAFNEGTFGRISLEDPDDA